MLLHSFQAYQKPRGLRSINIAIVLAIGLTSCSQRVEKNPMKVGETISIMPTAFPSAKSLKKSKHVRLVLDMGGKIAGSYEEIQFSFFKSEITQTPVLTAFASELSRQHQTTRCPKDVYLSTRDALVGDVIFCNNSLDIEDLKYFVAKRPGKDDKIATYAVLEFEDVASDLSSYFISFN